MNNFGDFLYKLRKEKGLTQAELADALGVTNKAVSKWETGEAMPETSLLLPISRIFGVTVDELLDGKRLDPSPDKDGAAIPDDRDIADFIKNHLFTRGKDDVGKKLSEKICSAICAALMLVGIAAYLTVGVFTGGWHPYWVILPACAFACGIIGIVFEMCNKSKRRKKFERGENPIAGGICGIIVLVCLTVYLLLGALANLWHPYWMIVICGAVACGVVNAVGEIVVCKNNNENKKD